MGTDRQKPTVEGITIDQALKEISLLLDKMSKVSIFFGGENGYLMLTFTIDLLHGNAVVDNTIIHFKDDNKNAIGIPTDKVKNVLTYSDRMNTKFPEYHLNLADTGSLVENIMLVFK